MLEVTLFIFIFIERRMEIKLKEPLDFARFLFLWVMNILWHPYRIPFIIDLCNNSPTANDTCSGYLVPNFIAIHRKALIRCTNKSNDVIVSKT